jgi:DNA-binding transcriptional MerR regulator
MRRRNTVAQEFRLDELARLANVASTTIRLYRSKGLLPPPRLEGRTGWYDESHLRRLRLIARLQAEGHSLAGIGDLIGQWEQGRSLDAVVGVEAGLDALLGGPHEVVLDPVELLERFPAGAMTTELMQTAARLGLVEAMSDGNVRIADRRFIDTGAALAHLGVPLDVVLAEWEAVLDHTDEVARRFVDLFERHLAPTDWQHDLDSAGATELAETLARLHTVAHQVLSAALDASLATIGRRRLSALLDPSDGTGPVLRDNRTALGLTRRRSRGHP